MIDYANLSPWLLLVAPVAVVIGYTVFGLSGFGSTVMGIAASGSCGRTATAYSAGDTAEAPMATRTRCSPFCLPPNTRRTPA